MHTISSQTVFLVVFSLHLRKRSALAVNSLVITHCFEVSCKEDQIMSVQRNDLSLYNCPTNSELLLNNSRIRADPFKF